MFARGTDTKDGHNPPVGSRTGYAQHYFYKQIKHVPASEGNEESPGTPAHDEEEWHYQDGSAPAQRWKIASEKILHAAPVLGDLSPDKDDAESVTINAPLLPRALDLPEEFDGNYVMYDGKEGKDPDGNKVKADGEQSEDFNDDVTYQERRRIRASDEKGLHIYRYETWKEVEQRREAEVGHVPVSPTNHAAILRFKNQEKNSSPVADVLSYDVTVGLGYAWHDEQYWNYLLDLADWKKSDPYYRTGKLPDSDKTMPPGIVTGEAPASAPQPASSPMGDPW